MPAVSQAKTPCIVQLASELGFASKPTLLRHLERIDELGPQVDPEMVYPEDWIVFRITGYRPEINRPAMVPGEALRGDLSAIAERLSESAKLTPGDLSGPYETIDSLTKRWGVSRKTIERYRRLGLIARRLNLGSGRRSVVFMLSAVEWFELNNRARLGKAASFDRYSQAQMNQFERWAKGYRRRLGWTRSQTASRISERSGHSHEGVRKALIRLDRDAKSPIFNDPGQTTTRDQMMALRATLRGIEPGKIAHRLGRSRSATLRAINSARAGVIMSVGLQSKAIEFESEQEILESPAVIQGLSTRAPLDLRELTDSMREFKPTVVYEESMRAKAMSILLARAGQTINKNRSSSPSGRVLDQIETDLRLVGMLKAELIQSQMGLVLQTIEHKIDGKIDTLDPSRASFLVFGSIRVASLAIDRYDPSHSARIAAPVGLAVTRFVSRQPDIAQPLSEGKATRRIAPGYRVEPWTSIATPWLRWLMPDPRVEHVLDRCSDRDQLVLNRRFGFDGSAPIDRSVLAGMLDTTPTHAARYEREAVRNARAIIYQTTHEE